MWDTSSHGLFVKMPRWEKTEVQKVYAIVLGGVGQWL